MDGLIAEARRGAQRDQLAPLLCHQTGLLAQLALCAEEGILTDVVQLASRDLQRDAVQRRTELVHHGNASLIIHRNDRSGTLVQHDLAQRHALVGKLYLPMFHINDHTVKLSFLADDFLGNPVHNHTCPLSS